MTQCVISYHIDSVGDLKVSCEHYLRWFGRGYMYQGMTFKPCNTFAEVPELYILLFGDADEVELYV